MLLLAPFGRSAAIKTVNWSLQQEEWQKKERKKENKNKTALEPRGINQRDELSKWHLSF